LVEGKTRVKENICRFRGKITIQEAVLFAESELPAYKQGMVTCTIKLFEDSSKSSTGYIEGKMISSWYIDNKQRVYYDALTLSADGFSNNDTEAKWTSYKTKKSKVCNWGDFRIPGSDELDTGTGEFMVNEKYAKNGWQNYMKLISDNQVEAQKAQKLENKRWW
jgi:hypothetical protein